VKIDLVKYEREHMHGIFNKIIEEGNFNKNIYNKKKMDIVRQKVHDICVMVKLNDKY
jgi:hypothetical protein